MTDRDIEVVERHISRFDRFEPNQIMVDRLRRIARGEIEPTPYDLSYYSHELREYVRYRRQGFPTGAGDDGDLWNNAPTATLEDYRLYERCNDRWPWTQQVPTATLEDYRLYELDANRNRVLYHPDTWHLFPR